MEGPSLVILREQLQSFEGKKILAIEGNSKIDQQRLVEQQVSSFKSWGKHLLICLNDCTVRVHFLMFGSYRINEKKDAAPRLSFLFDNGELNLYSCSIRLIEEDLDEVYDWSADVLSDQWDPSKARKSLRKLPDAMVCDALLNQDIFAGVGNIIKNEVLFRIKLHPESTIGQLPRGMLTALVDSARAYSFDFYEWKKLFQLKKHWLAYNKKTCPRCDIPFVKKPTGVGKRRSFFCINCQKRYD